MHEQRKFLDVETDLKELQQLNKFGELFQCKQIAVFPYTLKNKTQYGFVAVSGRDLLIGFQGGEGKEKPNLWEQLSPDESIGLYDFFPMDDEMQPLRDFFDIPKGYYYEDKPWYLKIVEGILVSFGFSEPVHNLKVNKDFLYAALSARKEIFSLIDQYTQKSQDIYNITLTGRLENGGISWIVYVLLHQKFKSEGLVQNVKDDLRIMRSFTFENRPVFNINAREIFNKKINQENIISILSHENQKRIDALSKALDSDEDIEKQSFNQDGEENA